MWGVLTCGLTARPVTMMFPLLPFLLRTVLRCILLIWKTVMERETSFIPLFIPQVTAEAGALDQAEVSSREFHLGLPCVGSKDLSNILPSPWVCYQCYQLAGSDAEQPGLRSALWYRTLTLWLNKLCYSTGPDLIFIFLKKKGGSI